MSELLSNVYLAWGVATGFVIVAIAFFIVSRYINLQKDNKNIIRSSTPSDFDVILTPKQSAKQLASRNSEIDNFYTLLLRQLETSKLSESAKRRMLNEYLHTKEASDFNFRKYSNERQKESVVETKKEQFINLPNIRFHFVDKGQVESYYDDYFKEPTIESLVSEITGEVDAEVKANLPQIIESRIGSKDINKWMSTIKLPDVTLNRKFLRYQKETIKNEQVILGIEEVEIELTELDRFESIVENFEKRYGLVIGADQLKATRATLREKAAGKTLDRLEKVTGWVLVDGKFKIKDGDKFYTCVYEHPVNEYLTEQTGHITITVLIKKDNLEPHIAGNYAQSIERLIPLRVYGQIWAPIDRNTKVWDLQITPLAVY